MFRQLSFDTSKADVHLALIEDGSPIRELILSVNDAASGTARQEAANLLIPGIDQLMRDAGWAKKDLDCLIVGTGPGGFTGIRTSVVTARALAQALMLPLYPVSYLECLSSALQGEYAIVLYATMGHYFLAMSTTGTSAVATNDVSMSDVAMGDVATGDVALSYVAQHELAAAVDGVATIYADERAREEMRQPEDPVRFHGSPAIEDLPTIQNIAVQQAKFAWKRLSLNVNDIYERLNGIDKPSDTSQGTEAQPLQHKLHAELRAAFPYQAVVPTYLRAPSVTLKKTNV